MNKRLIIAVAIALIVTIAVVYSIFTAVNNMSKPEETIAIAVAKTEIKAGSILKPNEMYEYIEIPKNEYIDSYVTYETVIQQDDNGRSVAQLIDMLKGKEALATIYKGERIVKARISNNESEVEEFKNMRRMTYTAQGVQNLAGQIKVGDKIDFWLRYTLYDKENQDSIIVVDKILNRVPVVKALDSNLQEIKNSNEVSTTIEVLLTQEEIQEFIKWRDLGKITLVKVPTGVDESDEKEVNRKKMSINELIWDVISMTEDEMNRDDIVRDESKKNDVSKYEIVKEVDANRDN